MAIQYSTAYRTSAMSNLNTTIGTNAQIIIYSGTAPANVGTAPTGTALVTFTGNATAFGSAASGVLTANAVANATAGNTGTAGYFRINTSGGTAVLQGTVGTAGADMIVTNTSIASGQTCQFTSLTITAYGA
jgi:magnesium-transporting ATPase (P-type)